MNPIYSHWLPTLVSAIGVFIVSSLVHTALRAWHRNDQSPLPGEPAVADALRGTPVGDYRMPFAAHPGEMKSDAFQQKLKAGPVAIVTVVPGDIMASFQKSLIQWFIYSLLIGWLAGHMALVMLPMGADGHDIFHAVGITSFMAYGFGHPQSAMWGGKPWMPVIKSMVDGLVYASVTAGVFVWLWPS